MYIQKVYISKTADTLQTFQNIQLYGVTAPSTVFAALFFISNYFFKINYNFQILQVTASCIICLQEILAMYCKKLLQRLARFSCTVLQDTIAMFCKTFSHTFFLAQFCKKLLQRFARFSCTVLQNTIAMFCKIFLHRFARYFCNVLQDFLAVLQNTFATFWQEAFKIFYKTLHLTFFSKIFQWFSLLLPLALPTIP